MSVKTAKFNNGENVPFQQELKKRVDAYFKNKEGKFEASNEVVQKLAKNYSSYRYLGAKGLVVMASNFYGLKDSFQATYILESVIKNFTDYKDVVAEAQTALDTIKKEEAKTNSSISK